MKKMSKVGIIKNQMVVTAMLICFIPTGLSADTIRVGGTGAAMGTMKVLAHAFQQSHPNANVQIILGLGSGGAKRALLEGALDIAVTAKAGKKAENVPGAVAIEYGRTPFVFATSKSNRVSGLTMEQIVKIYGGETTTWPDGKRLRLILRPESDSDTDILKSISPAMAHAVKSALSRAGMKIAVTDQDSADAIETVSGALGTSTLALILSEKRSLRTLAVDQVMPTPKTVADGSYRYFKSFYAITRRDASESARKFVAFMVSPQGREILDQLGHWAIEEKK